MQQDAFVIRPISMLDLDWLYETTNLSGAGLTSLQHDKEYLQHRIQVSEQSFADDIPIEQRIYLFVRENLADKQLVGVSGIDACVGYKEIFYNYLITTIAQASTEFDVRLEHKVLSLVNDFQDATELISTWLHPNFRGQLIGKILSLSRFLFIARFPHWFSDQIIAEIRGVCDDAGNSPFWEAVGKNFFSMSFAQADYLTLTTDKQFIADLVPRDPIYIDLLPAEAKAVIGIEHPRAQAARHLLEDEGFVFKNYVDIFDGGPVLQAQTKDINTIAKRKIAIISRLSAVQDGLKSIIYNHRLDARMTVGLVKELSLGEISIDADIAKIINVKAGDEISYRPL